MEGAVKPTIGKNVLGCVGMVIIVFLILLLGLGLVIAKTGIVRLPLLSRAYHGPQPTRLIAANALTLDQFRVLLASRFVTEANTGKRPPYTIRVTEAELTGALMGGIEEGVRDEGWRESFAQAVIEPDRIEVLLKLEKGNQTADFLIEFVPQIENGGVRLVPISFQFGDYPIPVSWAERIAGTYFKRDFGMTTLSIGEAKLSKIELQSGAMEITASPTISTP